MKEPIITARTIWTLIILIVVALLLGMVVYNPLTPVPQTQVEESNSITVSGNMTCLPHKDTTGPVTLECAYGLKSLDGIYYALDLASVGDQAQDISFDNQITVSGHLTPAAALSSDRWQQYDMAGIIQVDSITQE